MIVVSDTSPLTALLTIGEAEILTRLFGDVVIPVAVQTELQRSHKVLPAWLKIKSVKNSSEAGRLGLLLDWGEAEAIELAKELRADRLLIDERKGRRIAVQEGVQVIGLLGVVLLAKRRRLIASARIILDRLETEAGMYLSPSIRDAALRSAGE